MRKILTWLDRWTKQNDLCLTFFVFGMVSWIAFVFIEILSADHLAMLQAQLVAIAFWGLMALIAHQTTRFIIFAVEYFATPQIPDKYLQDEELELILNDRIMLNEKPPAKKVVSRGRPRKKKETVK